MPLNYRLALDVGSASLGWAVIRLDDNFKPKAIVVAGVRIFPDGRNPKDGTSLAVTRREARAARRRRDRLLKRKARLLKALVDHGLFPSERAEQKALERIDPFELRASGLDKPLHPHQLGRAIFHLNQRRGFKSNRKTDSKENEGSVMKAAISGVRAALDQDNCRTVGEWLYKRKLRGLPVRARFREKREVNHEGRAKIEKSYDLYIDRAMIEEEFDCLWAAQAAFDPVTYHEQARSEIKDIIFFQRKLRPVDPGRCTFFPDEPRAPLALPSVQRFRIYQEVNHLRWLDSQLSLQALSITQRNAVVRALDHSAKRTFAQLRKVAGLEQDIAFSIEDDKRHELRGNATSAILSRKNLFGALWFKLSPEEQDEVVLRLLEEESEEALTQWLTTKFSLTDDQASAIANVTLPAGYGSLSRKAIARILPALMDTVCTYDKAVIQAGIDHHSVLDARATGEVWPSLPYYGRALPRHVGFGTNNPDDPEEIRYGRIANPTVHIGLNQIRVVVNELIQRYGHPSQVVVEVARDLKMSRDKKREVVRRQAENQKRNARYRSEIARVLGIAEDRVSRELLHKMILWEELSPDPTDRRCPYSGTQIGLSLLLSDAVEIDHILPFSRTLDDSLNNKTVVLRQANRVKSNQTPWEAFGRKPIEGFDYGEILTRVRPMPKEKRYRFSRDGMEVWLRDDQDFLARALSDTSYLSRITKAYMELICPQATWVVPGRLTSWLRERYGLSKSDIIGWNGQKNRDDHRHHAIDACVIGVMDRSLLKRIADASARAHEESRDRLIANLPLPWPTYRDHVKRAINNIWVSHKPDHGYERAMHNDTAYGLIGNGKVRVRKVVNGVRKRVEEKLAVIPITNERAAERHGYLPNGEPRPYKGYKGDSNYCIEIVLDEGKWVSEVISTFQAYQVIREKGEEKGWKVLRHPSRGIRGKPLIMRLMINDTVRLEHDGEERTMRVAKISGNGQIFFADLHEANVDARNRDASNPFKYVSKMAGSLRSSKARPVTVSPSGRLRDPGFTLR